MAISKISGAGLSSITAAELGTGSVDTDELVNNAVTSDKIVADAITSIKIVADAITSTKIAANAVTTTKILDSTTTTLSCVKNGTTTVTHATATFIVGTAVSGTGIPIGATIASVQSTTSFTLSAAATDSLTSTLTFVTGITAGKIAVGAVGATAIAAGAIGATELGTTLDLSSHTVTVPAATVTAHVVAFDDSKLRNDVGTLALHSAIADNKAAYNLSNVFVDQFEDSTGVDVNTDCVISAENIAPRVESQVAFTGDGNATNWDTTAQSSHYVFDNNAANTFLIRHPGSPSTDLGVYSYEDTDGAPASPFKFSANLPFQWTFEAYTASGTLGPYMALTPVGAAYSGDTNQDTLLALDNVFMFYGAGTSANSKLYDNGNVVKTFTDSLIGGLPYSNTVYLFQRNAAGQIKVYNLAGDGSASYNAPSNLFHTFTTLYTGEMQMWMGGHAGHLNEMRNLDYKQGVYVVPATGSFTSATQTTATAVTKMGIVVLYKNVSGTATLNTGNDLVASVNSDGHATTFQDVTLTAAGTFSTGINIAVANDVTLSGTTGTSPKYKISFANQSAGSRVVEIHGVALLY